MKDTDFKLARCKACAMANTLLNTWVSSEYTFNLYDAINCDVIKIFLRVWLPISAFLFAIALLTPTAWVIGSTVPLAAYVRK